MATTQIPRIVRSVMQKGASAGSGHMQHGSMGSMKAPKSSGGGGAKSSGGGGGGGGNAFAGGFDTEGGSYDSANATTATHTIGPFSWGGDLTEGAKRVRQKMTDSDTASGKALDQLSNRLAQGQHLGDALRGLWQDNPSALHDMVAGGLFKNGMESLAKTLNDAGAEKGANYQVDPFTGRVTNKVTATSRQITDEQTGQPVGGATPGSLQQGQDENGNPIIVRSPGSRSSAAPGVTYAPQGQTPLGQANTLSQIGKNNAQTDLDVSKTTGQNQKNADPMAGKPYKISQQDGKLISAAPSILGSMDILRRWAPDANGLLTGPTGDLAAKLFGTNDANMVWSAAKNSLTQSLMVGGVPSSYAGSMKEFLKTLPNSWENARFNTTELGASAAAMRQTVNARLANVEQENGGRPYTPANQNDLKEVGIIPPSAGWDNPLAIVKAGPDALKNASDEQLTWLRDHNQMLNPAEKAAGKAEAMRRAGMVASPQQQNQQDMPSQQDQTPAPSPQDQQQQQQTQQAPPTPSDGAPLAPNPQLGQAPPPADDA